MERDVFVPILLRGKLEVWELQKVVLIKFKYRGIEVEVVVNHVCQIYNSKMLKYFMNKYPNYKNLVMTLKSWLKSSSLERKETINSYTLSLMALGFYLAKGKIHDEFRDLNSDKAFWI